MKRAYNQKVLLCFQTLFIYGIGKGEVSSVFCVLHHMKQVGSNCCYLLQRRLLNWTKPLHPSLLLGTIMDLSRGKAEPTCRECPLAPTTHCAAPTNQTANMYHNGSASPGASGKSSSDMEASFVHCSTRDPAPLASPSISCILEAQVQSNVSKTKNLSRGHRIDQRDGAEQSALGSRAYSWRVAQARYSRV